MYGTTPDTILIWDSLLHTSDHYVTTDSTSEACREVSITTPSLLDNSTMEITNQHHVISVRHSPEKFRKKIATSVRMAFASCRTVSGPKTANDIVLNCNVKV